MDTPIDRVKPQNIAFLLSAHGVRDKLLQTWLKYTAGVNRRKILLFYYAATAIFVGLDYVFDVNVRLAFLEHHPGLRAGYYVILLACFAAALLQPRWTLLIGIVESLVTLVGLILNMALRTMVVTDAMIETGAGLVTPAEIVNFIISGGIAYISWTQGLQAFFGGRGRTGS